MKRITLLALSLAVASGGCSRGTPEQQAIAGAVTALGGDRITQAKTLSIDAEGVNYNLGQDVTPEAHDQQFAVTAYTRQLDFGSGAGRMRVEQTRSPKFPYFGGQQPQSQTFGLDGDVAYGVAPNGTATRSTDLVARDRRMEFYHHPVSLLRAAQQPNATVSNVRTEGNERLVDIATPDGVMLTLAMDAASSQPTRITSRSYNVNLGDVVLTTRFADYQDVNGATLPGSWTSATDDFVTAEMRVTKQALDASIGDLAAPAAAASAPATVFGAPPNVTSEELAPGVWLLAGGSHHSVVVEFKDHLMLIEAPQNEERALAVIAKARELRPGKPLTEVVNTHHHFDHTGGVRAAVSEGLTLVTQSGNAAFFEAVAKRPHTIVQDALAKKPAALKLDAVADTKTFDDGNMTVNVYHVADNPHTHTMLMAHLPKQRILVEVDVFTPGSAVSPYSPNLLENIKKLNLRIDRVVPLHSTMAPYAQLVKVATSVPTGTN